MPTLQLKVKVALQSGVSFDLSYSATEPLVTLYPIMGLVVLDVDDG